MRRRGDYNNTTVLAGVVELADARDSKSRVRKGVRVRPPPPAPKNRGIRKDAPVFWCVWSEGDVFCRFRRERSRFYFIVSQYISARIDKATMSIGKTIFLISFLPLTEKIAVQYCFSRRSNDKLFVPIPGNKFFQQQYTSGNIVQFRTDLIGLILSC